MQKLTVIAVTLSISIMCQAQDGMRVAFVNPDSPGNPFWDAVTQFMQAAARGLNIQLQVYYGEKNRIQATQRAVEAVQSPAKPDYLIFVYQAGQGIQVLKAAEAANVHSFIINTDIVEGERSEVGKPREKFRYWLGHMSPDDVQAGRDLAEQLIAVAKQKNRFASDRRIHAVALSGSRDSTAALDRNKGLEQALAAHPEVHLQQLLFSKWDPELVSKQAPGLLARFPETAFFWSASDGMALAVLEGLAADTPVLTGGIDWTNEGIHAVQQGQLVATVGGHFMEGGLALVLLRDYSRGIDFASEGATIRSRMQIINQSNVRRYVKTLGEQRWDNIDFRKLSKAYNPRLKKYDFSLAAILNSAVKKSATKAGWLETAPK